MREYPKAKPAAKARQEALRRLISEHEAEYNRYHSEERMKVGLSPEVAPDMNRYEYLRTENERLRARLAELEQEPSS